MPTLNSSLTWVGESSSEPSKKWLLSMAPLSTATDNIGIPSYPFIKKAYLSLESIREVTTALNIAEDKSAVIEELLRDLSTFVRVAEPSDYSVPRIEDISDEISSTITANWYQGVSYIDQENPSAGVVVSISQSGNEFSDKNPYVLRTKDTEHLSIQGWVYFKDSSLQSIPYTTYDEAKKIQDLVEHRLTWMTKSGDNETYEPLSAGIASISPPRSTNLPNSTRVSGIRAGDTLRLNISGGSGEYIVTNLSESKLERLGLNTYRVIVNEPTVAQLQVTDNSNLINTVITLTIETEEMEE